MKSLFVFLFSLCTVSLIHAQTWTWSADMPKAGEVVKVDVKDLDVEDDIHIVAFSFQGKELLTTDINYIVDHDGIHMTLLVPPETNWIRLVIKDENNQAIAGDQRAVTKEGVPSKSSLMEQALAASSYYRPMGLKRDEAAATALYREAIQANPKWLDNPEVLKGYYIVAKASGSEEDLKTIKTHLLTFDSKKEIESPDVLINALRITKDNGDTILYQSLRRKLDLTYPQSLMSQEDQLARLAKAVSLEDKIAIRNQFKSTYSINEQNKGIWDNMTSSLAELCATKEDWKQVEAYINEIIDPMTRAGVSNDYAWTLAGEGIEGEAPHLDVAALLSASSLNCLTQNLKKPATLSKTEWEKNLDYSRAMYGDTYALILYKQGKYNEAIDHQSFAVKTSKYNDIEMNERYVVYLEKADQKEELLSFVDNMMEMGKSSEKMKEIHKRIWTTEKTPDQLYNQYVSKLEAKAKENRLEEIQAMWMDAPAVSFTLKNLNGDEVSLSDYKGKTVVLDFWATWCGPCKASFPGMKNAVEHYAQDKNVVFLFIDTWENGENIPGRVSKFITDNNYPFHVLLDGQGQVVSNYKVEGIPTKFIIDKDQRIRFKSVGYGGNNEVLVQELITMIEMAQNGGKLQKS